MADGADRKEKLRRLDASWAGNADAWTEAVRRGLLESRRGLGLFVTAGARERLKAAERRRFLEVEWPRLRARLRRLGIGAEQLHWGETR